MEKGDSGVGSGNVLTALPHLSSSKGLPGYPGLKGEMGEMGPQVRLVGVGTGSDGKSLLLGPQDNVLVEENDKGWGTLEMIALPRE